MALLAKHGHETGLVPVSGHHGPDAVTFRQEPFYRSHERYVGPWRFMARPTDHRWDSPPWRDKVYEQTRDPPPVVNRRIQRYAPSRGHTRHRDVGRHVCVTTATGPQPQPRPNRTPAMHGDVGAEPTTPLRKMGERVGRATAKIRGPS